MMWLYRLLLRLYPAAFYAQFADEMADTFALVRQESGLAGVRELVTLPVAILREHSRLKTVWYMLLLLMPPALLGCAVLLFRPVHRFYLSTNLWLLYIGLTFAILGTGWLMERRLTVLALPTLGYLLSIALRIFPLKLFPGYTASLAFNIAVPALLLVVVLVMCRREWKSWLPYVIAQWMIAMLVSALVIQINAAFHLPIPELVKGYILGALIPVGMFSLLILAGMPFAPRFGSMAVLLIVGYLFFDLLGLSSTLPNPGLQNTTGAVYVVLILLVIPLLVLKLPHRAGVLAAVALAYGLHFVIQSITGSLDSVYLLYRVNELAQTLIALYVAMRVYGRMQRPAPPHPRPLSKHGEGRKAAPANGDPFAPDSN
jgi:hypothetical protein